MGSVFCAEPKEEEFSLSGHLKFEIMGVRSIVMPGGCDALVIVESGSRGDHSVPVFLTR